jgi:sec-independent protein translocase protein TatA
MALDDPVVLLLIVVAVIFLFGGSRIPGLARALGEARREFDRGFRGQPPGAQPQPETSPVSSTQGAISPDDPLVVAAQREGIDTKGKTREQIASELSWKLNKK